MWRDHFQQLYNSKSNSKYHLEFISRLQDFSISDRGSYFLVYDVINVINLQTCNKPAGPDGIHMEAYIYGGYRLHVFLSLLFEMFMLWLCSSGLYKVYIYSIDQMQIWRLVRRK